MFVAMNRFKIRPGREQDFETIWRERETFLEELPGFKAFHLLRGPSDDEHTLYASHTVWASRADFEGLDQIGSFPSGSQGRRRA